MAQHLVSGLRGRLVYTLLNIDRILSPHIFLPICLQLCARDAEAKFSDCFWILSVACAWVLTFKTVFCWFLHFLFSNISRPEWTFFSLTTEWIVTILCTPVGYRCPHGITERFCDFLVLTWDMASGISRTCVVWGVFNQKNRKKIQSKNFKKSLCNPMENLMEYILSKNGMILSSTIAKKRSLAQHFFCCWRWFPWQP